MNIKSLRFVRNKELNERRRDYHKIMAQTQSENIKNLLSDMVKMSKYFNMRSMFFGKKTPYSLNGYLIGSINNTKLQKFSFLWKPIHALHI